MSASEAVSSVPEANYSAQSLSTSSGASEAKSPSSSSSTSSDVQYFPYTNETELYEMQKMIDADLSEPYSVFTYRQFSSLFPDLTFYAKIGDKFVGCVISKLEYDSKVSTPDSISLSSVTRFVYLVCRGAICTFSFLIAAPLSIFHSVQRRTRGYIGMLVVDKAYRGKRIGSTLVRLSMRAMQERGADMATLETECTNTTALALYEQLGFVRSKLLPRYYMNGNDAFRLKFWFRNPPAM